MQNIIYSIHCSLFACVLLKKNDPEASITFHSFRVSSSLKHCYALQQDFFHLKLLIMFLFIWFILHFPNGFEVLTAASFGLCFCFLFVDACRSYGIHGKSHLTDTNIWRANGTGQCNALFFPSPPLSFALSFLLLFLLSPPSVRFAFNYKICHID